MTNIIAVTMGDPAGIGPGIIKSLVEGKRSTRRAGSRGGLRADAAADPGAGDHPRAELQIIGNPGQAQFSAGTINVIDEPLADPQGLRPGEVQAQAGDLAYRCIKRATDLAMTGEVFALATAPLNKALHLAGHNFPGHTEMLAQSDADQRFRDGAVYR